MTISTTTGTAFEDMTRRGTIRVDHKSRSSTDVVGELQTTSIFVKRHEAGDRGPEPCYVQHNKLIFFGFSSWPSVNRKVSKTDYAINPSPVPPPVRAAKALLPLLVLISCRPRDVPFCRLSSSIGTR